MLAILEHIFGQPACGGFPQEQDALFICALRSREATDGSRLVGLEVRTVDLNRQALLR